MNEAHSHSRNLRIRELLERDKVQMLLFYLGFLSTLKAQSDCSFAGFPCCQNPVPSPVYDNNKYGYEIV